LRRSVELLAELHDVDALLAERRADRRRRVGRSRRDLQLHVALYLLRHRLLLGPNAPAFAGGSPLVTGLVARDAHTALRPTSWLRRRAGGGTAKNLQTFSTCEKSSSTGVERPRICTATCSRFFS